MDRNFNNTGVEFYQVNSSREDRVTRYHNVDPFNRRLRKKNNRRTNRRLAKKHILDHIDSCSK